MAQLALDTESMYTPRAINREVLFDTKGAEGKCIVVVPDVLMEFCGH